MERPTPSYQPTRWPLANRALDVADVVTRGRADWIQRLVSYLFVGGFAATVNLAVFSLFYYVILAPLDHGGWWPHLARYMAAFLIGTEISILANFIPNDYLTFRHLPGHQRSWAARCLRFHLTAVAGTIVTLAISFTFHLFDTPAWLGQAIALILAVAFNFTFHHLFTYRHVKH